MGTAVKQDVKDKRHATHSLFDSLWRDTKVFFNNRREAYSALAEYMGKPTHIAEVETDEDFQKIHEFCIAVRTGELNVRKMLDKRSKEEREKRHERIKAELGF